MRIGIIPDPLNHPDWPQIKAFLEPAAKRGNVPVLDPGEMVWAIYSDDFVPLVGAATARPTVDGFGEVVLVGGRGHTRWIDELDRLIGMWLAAEGMKSVRAYGRAGWIKVLKNWTVIGKRDGVVAYERRLDV